MGQLLELERLTAEEKTAERDMLAATHLWDGTRVLARLVFGEDDPRVWAALTRSARALVDFNEGPPEEEVERKKVTGPVAASVAAGALAGLKDAYAAPPTSSGLWNPLMPGNEEDRERDWKRGMEMELAFAEETLERSQARPGALGGGPSRPIRSLGDALYPGHLAGAEKDPFPSSDELRARLAAAEGPGGPGPRSLEALALRSLLGAELWDTGGKGAEGEAFSLMREAVEGLDKEAGARAPDALAAKERLARRLAVMGGHGRIVPMRPAEPSAEDAISAVRLFRTLERLAPEGQEGEQLRCRAGSAAAGVKTYFSDDLEKASMDFMFSGVWLMGSPMSEAGPGDARGNFDQAEFLVRNGSHEIASFFYLRALTLRRHLFGSRHPETAVSLSRSADLLLTNKNEAGACAHWALALEALEGLGDRHEISRADLELRIGRTLTFAAEAVKGLPMLKRAVERYVRLRGEASQNALEASAFLAQAQYWAVDIPGAEGTYREMIKLLDGAPPRKDPDPALPGDDDFLSVALAGAGATMIFRGDRPGGEALLKRSAEIRPQSAG
ncbi:MAG: hypothetical protein LBR80_02020 [Deltaproteobacteria bacterium]|jgi:hypothetical protein|nr:hypothetical protein [Deltaproteobacteria bacterium]